MSLDKNDKSLDPANSMSISPILDVREEIILKTIVEEYIKNRAISLAVVCPHTGTSTIEFCYNNELNTALIKVSGRALL